MTERLIGEAASTAASREAAASARRVAAERAERQRVPVQPSGH